MINIKSTILAGLAVATAAMGAIIAADARADSQTITRSAAIFESAICDRQHWPSFSAECLVQIDGAPIERQFRIVTSY